MNILLLNWRDPENPRAGGAEVYLHEVARRWILHGHHVEWIAAGFARAPRLTHIDGIKIRRVGTALTVYLAAAIEYLSHLHDRIDVIIDAENGIPFFSPLYASKPKLLLMHHVHTDVFKNHLPRIVAPLFIWLESKLMPRLYANVPLVAVSESTREEIERQNLTKMPIAVVHNGVAEDLIAGNKSREPTIAYVGRLKAYKRIDFLLRAVKELRSEFPAIVLRIGGRGDDEPRLRALAEELGLIECVSFEGFVSHEHKRAMLQEAWAFVTLSEIEGWGLTIIEANACATPAIGFKVPGVREAIRHGESGLLVETMDELTGALGRVLRDAELRNNLSIGAKRRARDFSWDRTASDFLNLIRVTLKQESEQASSLTKV